MTDMKFDPGTPLGAEIINMSRQELCEFISKLCRRILAEVGTRGYRGGIYPDNISLSPQGDINLGLAKSEGWEGQELEFLAPELYWNGKRGPASDIYSLGMLMYYAMNKGVLPYEGECDNPQLRRMNGDNFPPPAAAGRRLGEIIAKATAFRPEDRYKSLEEMQIMLDNCLKNLYLKGAPSSEAIFHKDDDTLTEIEKMMVGIIEREDEAPREIPADEPEENEPMEDKPMEDKTMEDKPMEAAPEEDEGSGETTALSPEELPQEEPENVKVYEPAPKKPKKKSDPVPPRQPIPILTEEKNPELEPVILSRNVQPAVKYGKAEKVSSPEQSKKHRGMVLAVVLVICALIIVTALLIHAMLNDFSWKKDDVEDGGTEQSSTDNLPIIDDFNPDGHGIVVIPEQTQPEESPQPQNEQKPVESSYQIIKADLSWTEARDKCIEMGGYLVVINDEEEFNKVSQLAQAAGIQRIWIGGHRINDTIVWESGEEDVFYPASWGVKGGEPSYVDSYDGTAEDYLMLWNNNGWAYNDSRNDPAADYPQWYEGTMGYVCEFRK